MSKRALLTALSAFALTYGAQALAPAQKLKPALNDQEQRGRALYEKGVSPSGEDVVARVGELEVTASTLKCAECHGLRGEGKSEGGVAAGALTWKQLTDEDGHTHPTGRRHGPFDESTFARAVAYGLDPDENELHMTMPRYGLPKKDLADLIAYLKRIGEEPAGDAPSSPPVTNEPKPAGRGR